MKTSSLVPVFGLYGEQGAWPTPDLLHIESIAERSRLHGWDISPHRHADLAQLLYLRGGAAEVVVDGQRRWLGNATLQLVPALCVHGFLFSSDVEGYVLSLARPLVESVSKAMGVPLLAQPLYCQPGEQEQRWLDLLFDNLRSDYHTYQPGRELNLEAAARMLLVWVHRRSGEQESSAHLHDRGQRHFSSFLHLLEVHYREHWPIKAYAEHLGISAPHLNTLCRRCGQQSALQVINQRLLLEAKRSLIYTTMTVSQISDHLGFSEPGYFSRFFKRYTGASPRTFRDRDATSA